MKALMNRRSVFFLVMSLPAVMLGLGAGGCGREKPVAPEPGRAATPGAAGVNGRAAFAQDGLRGSVAGAGLTVKDAVFLWRENADDLAIMLGDRAQLCPLLASGAMPRDATLLLITLKHNTPENRDAPFSPGVYPVREPDREKRPQDVKAALFVKLDGACGNTLSRADGRAVSGEVVLDAIRAGKDGAASGRLKLVFGARGETLEGPFSAAFCPMPEDAPEPRGCR